MLNLISDCLPNNLDKASEIRCNTDNKEFKI